MRKGFKLAALTTAMIASGSAFALGQGPVKGFGNWSATGGTISHACESGGVTDVTCEVIADGDGFKQLMVTDTLSGDTFIGTLVTDQGATGNANATTGGLGFADESYVKMQFSMGGNAAQTEAGILALQRLSETGADGTVFESRTEIDTASGTGAVPILINQALKNTGTDASVGDNFMSSFVYEASTDATTGERNGFQMQLDQIAGLSANGGNANDVQNFSLRERSGAFLGTGGTISMTGAVDPNTVDANGNPVEKTSLTYDANQDIKMVWLGQRVDLSSTTGVGAGQMGSLFGYLAFENVSNPDSTTGGGTMARFSLADVSSGTNTGTGGEAWAWDDQFAMQFGGDQSTLISGAPVMTDTQDDPSGGLVTLVEP